MSWVLPIAQLQLHIVNAMTSAFAMPTADLTKFPDRLALDELLEHINNAGVKEQYRVVMPGITGGVQASGSCDVQNFAFPIEIYIARQVDGSPQDDGSVMLPRAGTLANTLWGWTWTSVPVKEIRMTRLTTRFPQAEQFNRSRFAVCLLEVALLMEITP